MGNFSRSTFDPLKHYVGVRLQQGVPIVDADWNEMEDIRRHEQRLSLKCLVGDGMPAGQDDAFSIKVLSVPGTLVPVLTDFAIGNGLCLVDGQEVVNDLGQETTPLRYRAQRLYENYDLAKKWDVPVLPALTTLPPPPPIPRHRDDLVYLDVWEREVDWQEDPNLVNGQIGVPTCVRRKIEWVVRVREKFADPGKLELVDALIAALKQDDVWRDQHAYLPLARLARDRSNVGTETLSVEEDLRRTCLAVLPGGRCPVPKNRAGLTITSMEHNTSGGMIFISSLGTSDDAHRLLTARKRNSTKNASLDWTFEIQSGDEPALAFWRANRPDSGTNDWVFPLTLGWNGSVGVGTIDPKGALHVDVRHVDAPQKIPLILEDCTNYITETGTLIASWEADWVFKPGTLLILGVVEGTVWLSWKDSNSKTYLLRLKGEALS